MDFEYRDKPRLTKADREAKKETIRLEAEKATSERKKREDAFRANFERLKAGRLAREKQ
jgi:hypothetical protein